MRSRWDENEAGRCRGDLALCTYVSRLLGAEPALVLYGGGNTSVKTGHGSAQVLHVKGSGADLAQIREDDFTPVRLDAVQALIEEEDLSNAQLADAVSLYVGGNGWPRPSIETLLHAVLPHRFVLHTHADSILAITNTAAGARIAGELFGELAPRVPFRESGFALAKAAHGVYQADAKPHTIGLVLLHHGIFAFGETARGAYENMLRLVGLAERYLQERKAWTLPAGSPQQAWDVSEVVEIRRALSRQAGFPLVMQRQDTPELWAFAREPSAAAWCAEGPATPQHAVFVKRTPLFDRDVDGYADAYRGEVEQHYPGSQLDSLGLDPAPRVVVDARLGVWTASVNAHHARMTGEIFRHDVEIMTRASGHDRYAGLPRSAILDAEIHYGGFEAKLRRQFPEAESLLGEVALLACDPGLACEATAQALAALGAEVVVPTADHAPGSTLDVQATHTAPTGFVRALVCEVGGLDILILQQSTEDWLDACLTLLERAPRGGRIVLVGAAGWGLAMQRRIDARDTVQVGMIDPDQVSTTSALADQIARLCRARVAALSKS